MKSIFLRFVGIFILGLYSLQVLAQSPSGDPEDYYYIPVGKTLQLYDNTVDSGVAKWVSSDSTILKISAKGLALGIKDGVTSVYTITLNGSVGTKSLIKVYNESTDSSITIDPIDTTIINPEPPIISEYYLPVGKSINITPPVMIALPYSWLSSDSSIARVDKNGTVIGMSEGNATIYISFDNGNIVTKYPFIIYSEDVPIKPSIPNYYEKLALGDSMFLISNISKNNIFVSLDSTFKSNNYGKYYAKKLGENYINEYSVFGELIATWIISVYDPNNQYIPEPINPNIYLSIGDTIDLTHYFNVSSLSDIDIITNGVLEQYYGSIYKAVGVGYCKGIVNSSGTSIYFLINVYNPKTAVNADSVKNAIALPYITNRNFAYQNYTKIEQINDRTIKIVFDKPINDISEVIQMLSLNIEIQDSTCSLCKSNASITIKTVIIDPSNNKALIITTNEEIPQNASIAVLYDNVSLLSTDGLSFNKAIAANETQVSLCDRNCIVSTISPNIASDAITIKADDIKHIDILDNSGKIIRSIDTETNELRVDISALRSGSYLVKIKTSKTRIISKRFIKL